MTITVPDDINPDQANEPRPDWMNNTVQVGGVEKRYGDLTRDDIERLAAENHLAAAEHRRAATGQQRRTRN